MNKLKTIGIPCLITCAVGVLVAGYVFPFVLAMTLAMTMPLLKSLITDGMAFFWALSFLQIVVLILLYVLTLLLLLKWFRGKERLLSLTFAFVVSVCLLLIHRHVLLTLLLVELIVEVFLIFAVSLIIVWKKTKQPTTTKNSHCFETVNH